MDEFGFKPLFLFSLPRSGSTLVQRVLAASGLIKTVAEPWILLPVVYAMKPHGVFAEYDHRTLSAAINDFVRTFPGGYSDYRAELRKFALSLYRLAVSSEKVVYFLDKTPRYSLIAKEVIDIFPEGNYIFLWRNPLAIAASIMETWGRGRWNLYKYKVDLYKGLDNLVNAYMSIGDRAYSVRYEDLVAGSVEAWQGLFDYLGIPFRTDVLQTFSKVTLNGRMGDPVGVKKYKVLSKEPIEKWKTAFSNPLRKSWARGYLRWIGKKRLDLMGYSYEGLMEELNTLKPSMRYLCSDVGHQVIGILYTFCELGMMKAKFHEWKMTGGLYPHK